MYMFVKKCSSWLSHLLLYILFFSEKEIVFRSLVLKIFQKREGKQEKMRVCTSTSGTGKTVVFHTTGSMQCELSWFPQTQKSFLFLFFLRCKFLPCKSCCVHACPPYVINRLIPSLQCVHVVYCRADISLLEVITLQATSSRYTPSAYCVVRRYRESAENVNVSGKWNHRGQ